MDRVKQFLARQNVVEFIKYTLASALALVVDYGCYWLLVSNKLLDLPKAAVVGYIAGLVVAYFLIADRVFKDGWLKDKKRLEALLFFISGMLGILLTYLTVKVAILLFGERLNIVKISAVFISFTGIYFFRKFIVFKRLSST